MNVLKPIGPAAALLVLAACGGAADRGNDAAPHDANAMGHAEEAPVDPAAEPVVEMPEPVPETTPAARPQPPRAPVAAPTPPPAPVSRRDPGAPKAAEEQPHDPHAGHDMDNHQH